MGENNQTKGSSRSLGFSWLSGMEETSIHKLQHEKDENVFQLCRFSADCSYIIEEFSELMPTYHLFEQVEESVKTRPFFLGVHR